MLKLFLKNNNLIFLKNIYIFKKYLKAKATDIQTGLK